MTKWTPKKIAAKFEEAAQILQDSGWCKGKWESAKTGAHCAEGAIYVAAGFVTKKDHERLKKGMSVISPDNKRELRNFRNAQRLMREFRVSYLRPILAFDYSIDTWNDSKGVGKATVIKAFRDFAARLRDGRTVLQDTDWANG